MHAANCILYGDCSTSLALCPTSSAEFPPPFSPLVFVCAWEKRLETRRGYLDPTHHMQKGVVTFEPSWLYLVCHVTANQSVDYDEQYYQLVSSHVTADSVQPRNT